MNQNSNTSEYDTFIIIVECDEFDHLTPERNRKRMIDVSQTFDGRIVYFIVWNPYTYKPRENQLELNLHERYNIVDNLISLLVNPTYILPDQGLCYVTHMFYDHWNCLRNTKWNCILYIDTIIE